jgi:hypothetical protein
LYSSLVSARAGDVKIKQEKARKMANMNLGVLLIYVLLVGSIQQEHYTIKLR